MVTRLRKIDQLRVKTEALDSSAWNRSFSCTGVKAERFLIETDKLSLQMIAIFQKEEVVILFL